MAIILNPNYIVPIEEILDEVTGIPIEQEPLLNVYYSPTMDEEIQSVYIVIDQVYINKLKKEVRVQSDYYKSKESRLKGLGKLETLNLFLNDLTDFLSDENIYQSAYKIIMNKLNEENVDKYISDIVQLEEPV